MQSTKPQMYKRIYLAANFIEAYFIQGLLKQYNIETNLMGESLAIAAGGLPADVFQVPIMVNKKNFSQALEIISHYERTLREPIGDGQNWECYKCTKVNPEVFEVCWNCQEVSNINF